MRAPFLIVASQFGIQLKKVDRIFKHVSRLWQAHEVVNSCQAEIWRRWKRDICVHFVTGGGQFMEDGVKDPSSPSVGLSQKLG